MRENKNKWLSEAVLRLKEYREKQGANNQLPAKPKKKTQRPPPQKPSPILGELEKLGKIFKIYSKRSTRTQGYSICTNCHNEKACWHYAKSSVGSICLCSRCKNIFLIKFSRSNSDAIFTVVNRSKKI